jgi:hypothetical protein
MGYRSNSSRGAGARRGLCFSLFVAAAIALFVLVPQLIGDDRPPLSVTFSDANPAFLNHLLLPLEPCQVERAWPQLLAAAAARRGAAADGTSLLLVRVESNHPGRVQLALHGSEPVGRLASLVDLRQPPGTLATRPLGDGRHAALAVYVPPEDFGPQHAGPDAFARQLTLRASLVDSNGRSIDTDAPLLIVRRPVVLVHAMYHGPHTMWTAPGVTVAAASDVAAPHDRMANVRDDATASTAPQVAGSPSVPAAGAAARNPSLVDVLKSRGFQVFLCDYESTNGSGFSGPSRLRDNQRVVWHNPGGIRDALESYRKQGFAATQADVVGHSLGGLLARAYARGTPLPDVPLGALAEALETHGATDAAGWPSGGDGAGSSGTLPPDASSGAIRAADARGRSGFADGRVANHAAARADDSPAPLRPASLPAIGQPAGTSATADGGNWYRRPDNFYRGDIARLITLCTPHHGSELIRVAVGYRQAWGRVFQRDAQVEQAMRLLDLLFSIRNGGADLAPRTAILAAIGPTPVPAHAIACDASLDDYEHFYQTYRWSFLAFCLLTPHDVLHEIFCQQSPLCAAAGTVLAALVQQHEELRHGLMRRLLAARAGSTPPAVEPQQAAGYNRVLALFCTAVFGTRPHDGAVRVDSALGGLTGPYATIVPDALHSFAPRYPAVQQRIVELLEGSGEHFAPAGFPAAGAPLPEPRAVLPID